MKQSKKKNCSNVYSNQYYYHHLVTSFNQKKKNRMNEIECNTHTHTMAPLFDARKKKVYDFSNIKTAGIVIKKIVANHRSLFNFLVFLFDVNQNKHYYLKKIFNLSLEELDMVLLVVNCYHSFQNMVVVLH